MPSDYEIAAKYPQMAYMLNHPEVGPLLRNAYSKNMDSATFTNMIQNTAWYRTTQESARLFDQLRISDPSTSQAQENARYAELLDLVTSMGIPINVMNQGNLRQMAQHSLRQGLSEREITDMVIGQLRYSPQMGTTPGAIATMMQEARTMGAQYMVRVGDEQLFEIARRAAMGQGSVKDYETMYRELAKQRFPALAKFIDQGITPGQYFEGHRQEAAKLLEVSPDAIDFMNDTKWQRVLDHTDAKGNRGPMTIAETATYVRGLDEWKQTDAAQEQAASTAEGMLKMFGAVAS